MDPTRPPVRGIARTTTGRFGAGARAASRGTRVITRRMAVFQSVAALGMGSLAISAPFPLMARPPSELRGDHRLTTGRDVDLPLVLNDDPLRAAQLELLQM